MNAYLSTIAFLMLATASFGQSLALPTTAEAPKSSAPPATSTAPSTRPAVPPKKIPVPDAASLKNSLKLVNDVYKDELAKARTSEQKQTLAKAMLATAGEEKQPAGRYALFTVAMDLAAGAGDLETASAAIDRLDALYDLDALKLRSDAATAAARAARTPDQWKKLALLSENTIDSAINADRYDIARIVSEAVLSAARSANEAATIKAMVAKIQEIHEADTAYALAKSSLAVLASKPADPEANLLLGKYRCFIKGDWDAGLPMLALSGDETIKALAKTDKAGVRTPDDQVKLADGWWDLSDKSTGLSQRHIRSHAAKGYLAAMPKLTGLEKMRVQKRLDSLEADPNPVVQAPISKTIDLLALVDPAKDATGGPWVLKDKTLKSDDAGVSRIEFPYHPPVEYDFHVEFARDQGDDSVNMILAANGRHFMWTMGGWSNTILGFDEIAQVRANQNPKSVNVKTVLENGKKYDVVVKVRKAGLEAYVNGKVVYQWKTDYTDMGIPNKWDLRDAAALGVATHKSPTTFLKIEVIEVSGAGTMTRK